jgi:hypothetical protein
MRRITNWTQIIAIIIVIAFIGFLAISGYRSIAQPVERLRDDIGTQVSRITNPTPTILPNPASIVHEVRALARLETMQYTVEKVIVAETGQGPFGFLFGDRLLLVAHGFVVAGIDLGSIATDDIWFGEQGELLIVLPDAEVFVAALDNDKTFVYDRDTGLLTGGNVSLEAAARTAAEKEILNAALADGIIEQAAINAESFLYGFLRSLGFPDVIFASTSDRPVPFSTATP